MEFDTIVVGLGAMGSASIYQLAQTGQRVLGVDRFDPPHTLGSSHGETRIIREAYFEHPLYVPFVQRAYTAWRELEAESGVRLLFPTGGYMIGPPNGPLVSGARASAIEHRLPYEEISAAEVRRRVPVLRPTDDMVGLYEPRAGMLFPEKCIASFLRLARARGADIRGNTPITAWEATDSGVEVHHAAGRFRARSLVLAAGPWMASLLDLPAPLPVERVPVFWFDPTDNPAGFAPDRCPIYVFEHDDDAIWYGFPRQPRGIKVARHHQGATVSPDDPQVATPEEEMVMRSLLARFVPDANGTLREATTCLYTNTVDDHFVVDRHPRHPNVVMVSACSGHGFKFASVIGEIVADLVMERALAFDLAPFRVARLVTA